MAASKGPAFFRNFFVNPDKKRRLFEFAKYNRYGLYLHDLYRDGHPVIEEALRRCPEDIQDARAFRCIRAAQVDCNRSILPESEWTTFEDDQKNGRYLQPYMEEIEREIAEKKEWENSS